MHKFRSYIAFCLLLLFSRVLAPEQAILALHDHAHTSHEHTENDGLAHIDAKHTHCQVDHLFDVPFQPATSHFIFTKPLCFETAAFVYHSVWKYTFPNNACLRGPPVLS